MERKLFHNRQSHETWQVPGLLVAAGPWLMAGWRSAVGWLQNRSTSGMLVQSPSGKLSTLLCQLPSPNQSFLPCMCWNLSDCVRIDSSSFKHDLFIAIGMSHFNRTRGEVWISSLPGSNSPAPYLRNLWISSYKSIRSLLPRKTEKDGPKRVILCPGPKRKTGAGGFWKLSDLKHMR